MLCWNTSDMWNCCSLRNKSFVRVPFIQDNHAMPCLEFYCTKLPAFSILHFKNFINDDLLAELLRSFFHCFILCPGVMSLIKIPSRDSRRSHSAFLIDIFLYTSNTRFILWLSELFCRTIVKKCPQQGLQMWC